MKNIFYAAFAAIFFFILILLRDDLIFIIRLSLYVIAAGTILFLVLSGWYFIVTKNEEIKKIKADRLKKERDAEVKVVTAGNQVFISDLRHVWWNAAHLDTRFYRNSRETYQPAGKEEWQAWQAYHSPKIIEKTFKQLSDEIEDKPDSLFDLLSAYPHIMFIGGTGSGKTTQINHCISYHLRECPDAKIVWLSTHASLDIENIHTKAIAVQKGKDIASALNDLFTTYQARRDGQLETYSKVVIALDEWPELIDECDEWIKAGDILKRMSRGSRKTNINLILASHGGNVNDLGIAGHSSVKLDFAEVYLSARMTQQNKALWQNGRDKIEIDLPGLFRSNGKPRLLQLPEKIKEMSKEQEWLELVNGGMSKNEACLQVFNRQFAGNLVAKLNDFARGN